MPQNAAEFTRAAATLQARQLLNGKAASADGLRSEYAPINNSALSVMPRGSAVVMSDEIRELLDLINEKTLAEGKEVPFFLYGHTEGQMVVIDDIDAQVEDLQTTEATFDKKITDACFNFLHNKKNQKQKNKIIIHGHTHPRIGQWHNNFSYGDMISYIQFRDIVAQNSNGTIEAASCLLVNGQYNFLFYDGGDFYRFQNVFAWNGNDYTPLPCYRDVVPPMTRRYSRND